MDIRTVYNCLFEGGKSKYLSEKVLLYRVLRRVCNLGGRGLDLNIPEWLFND